MLNSWFLLIISRWIMLWNKAVFCLGVLIYKHLQMWRHNDVIGRNEYLISTWSESTVPYAYSVQFLFKSTHHSWRYGRKCEWVFFFWTQCSNLPFNSLVVFTPSVSCYSRRLSCSGRVSCHWNRYFPWRPWQGSWWSFSIEGSNCFRGEFSTLRGGWINPWAVPP